MAYSKVILNGTTLMDVTNDTVDAGNLLSGETATKNNGLRTTGTVVVPTKTSDLTNDSGFITSAQAPVQSVNGQTGAVSITIPTVPSASTTTPSMDGTASYGSGTTWARADHVHPTDTSRQAALVSGQNIKTINNESLLGSGNIDIQGGGGTEVTTASVVLNPSGWSNYTQTVSVTGVTASNTVIVSAAPSSFMDYSSARVYCSAQGNGTLTFTCSTTPTSALTVNVMIIDGGSEPTIYYAITDSSSFCHSITTDGSYGASVTTKATEAVEGDIVTYTFASVGVQIVVQTSQGATVESTFIGSFRVEVETFIAYQFTMPNDSVTLNFA